MSVSESEGEQDLCKNEIMSELESKFESHARYFTIDQN
jgi:hypothetical protein